VASILSRGAGGFFAENLAFVQNLIDWTNLDNDLISIRARGGSARRLERLEKPAEKAIEAVNYLLPVVGLLVLGLYRFWQRRNTAPVVTASATRNPARRASQEG
jgi:hypothetical protein